MDGLWIGGIKVDNTYYWVGRLTDAINYDWWSPGQQEGNPCLSLFYLDRKFDDADCEYNYQFVCEKLN